MALPLSGPLLGIDWGEIRTGIALCDEERILASPLTTLTQRRGKRFPIAALLDIIEARHPVGVVLGLPYGLDGGESASTIQVRQVMAQLQPKVPVPIELWDERLTTARALRAIREQGGSTRGRKADVDALAAAILLQHFLDSHRQVP
jgi:putative Holliday junction resolvase